MALSQEQINAILEGTGTYDAPTANAGGSADTGSNSLSETEQQFFQAFSAIAMESGSVAVSQALGKTVNVMHPELSLADANGLKEELSNNHILIQTGYLTHEAYESLLLIKDYDVAVIFDILMGKDGRNPDLEMGDLQISAIGEVINQLVGAAATALSKEFACKIAMVPPESELFDLKQTQLPAAYQNVPLLQIRYQLVIDGILDSELFELRSLASAQKLHQSLTGQSPPSSPASPAESAQMPPAPRQHSGPQNPTRASSPPPPVHPVEFAPLSPGSLGAGAGAPNLERILDIPLRVTVELGAARLKVKNVLDLAKGSIVELDKLSGENVDLLVNGRLMAKGEVVVINENFGVRITEILGPADRLQNLSYS